MELTVTVKAEGKGQNVALLPQADLIKGATGYLLAVHIGDTVYSVNVSDLVTKLALAIESDKKTVDATTTSE